MLPINMITMQTSVNSCRSHKHASISRSCWQSSYSIRLIGEDHYIEGKAEIVQAMLLLTGMISDNVMQLKATTFL